MTTNTAASTTQTKHTRAVPYHSYVAIVSETGRHAIERNDGQRFGWYTSAKEAARAAEEMNSNALKAYKLRCLREAAPDLLEIAKAFRAGCERGEFVGEVFFSQLLDRADAAIAKAEGQP